MQHEYLRNACEDSCASEKDGNHNTCFTANLDSIKNDCNTEKQCDSGKLGKIQSWFVRKLRLWKIKKNTASDSLIEEIIFGE